MNKGLTFTDAQIACLCFFCIYLSGCNHPLKPGGTGIEIRGSKAFVVQVDRSLKLLENKAPYAYEIIINNVGRIEQGEHSGMWANITPPTFELNDRTAFYSVTWCAGSIAHDSYHSKLYHDYKKIHSGPVPDIIWGGQNVELECIKHQINALKQIGAPKLEIDHCRQQDGSHYDINKDGKYDWDDYKKRDW